MVSRSTTSKGRRQTGKTSTEGSETPPFGAHGALRKSRDNEETQSPAPYGQLALQNPNPDTLLAGGVPGVAQLEALVQALNTLPADTRRRRAPGFCHPRRVQICEI